MIAIRQASVASDFESIYRFRYSIYVEEMNRKQVYADHERKLIVDPLDDRHVKLYAAWEAGEVVGTVRSNYLRSSTIGDYFNHYDLTVFETSKLEATSITTRLMVHKRHRNSTLGVRLAQETFRHGLEDGIATDFIDCNNHLVPYFTGLGYVIHRTNLIHPEYGPVTVMRGDLHDLAHLERVRSPFRKILRGWLSQHKRAMPSH